LKSVDPAARGFRKDFEQSARVDHLVKMKGESVGRPGRPQEKRILEDPNREPADLRFFAPADIGRAADGQGKELRTRHQFKTMGSCPGIPVHFLNKKGRRVNPPASAFALTKDL
jgi:hypothetical protein